MYLKISAYEDVTINSIEIFSNNQIPENEVSVAYCICSYNRESYISSFVKDIASHFIGNNNISFYITINGSPYSIDFSDNFTVINNRNLGGAGGFTKSIMAALKNKRHSHVILADDDIYIDKTSIYKTIAILKGLKPEYSDYFISGAMLSGDEKWLQYERNATLTSKGFIHHGAYEDTRSKHTAFYSAIAPAYPGIAGWWYCCIPIKVILEYDLPLPIFVRGDDVEYSIRCAKNILSFNGICVWHEPFFKKYNEIMEDYYLVRNLTIISLIYNQEFSNIKRQYIFKKFFKNIFIFDYVAAKLNIKALEDILTQQYLLDPELIHKNIVDYKNKHIDYKEYSGLECSPQKRKHIRKVKLLCRGILQYIFNIKGGNISSLGGYERNPRYFLGRKRAKIYIGNNTYRLYRFRFVKSWSLIYSFIKCYMKIKKNNIKLQRDLTSFRDQSAKSEAWNKIFEQK
nr:MULTISPECIES: glycosyltransferase [unclassified Gilliamella]